MVAPRVEFEGDALDAELVAAPHHVRHVAFELFKNAFRASMDSAAEHAGDESVDTGDDDDDDDERALAPPVRVLARRRDADVEVAIVDAGGGMARDAAAAALRLRAGARYDRLEAQQSYAMVESPLSGNGVGLPISRLYARHFGGELEIDVATPGTTRALFRLPLATSLPESLP